MDSKELTRQYWDDIHRQRWDSLARYFHANAVIRWHNTNEQFTVDEFVRVNAMYPGDGLIDIERLHSAGEMVISVARVHRNDTDPSFHATSFFEFMDGKISALDEYWGDDEKAPQWRLDQRIGRPISKVSN